MSQFTCCQCPEPPGYDPAVDDLPKYCNKCDCPSAKLIRESRQTLAILSAFPEFQGYESTPPERYRTTTASGWVYVLDEGRITGRQWSGSAQAGTPIVNTMTSQSYYSGSAATCQIPSTRGGNYFRYIPFVIRSAILKSPDDPTFGTLCENSAQIKLSNKDTEADAIARNTETDGFLETSIYEKRTTNVSFYVRKVKFSIELTNLTKGRAYEGCARIRKRRAYSGIVPDGVSLEWEDVQPFTFGPITPSATNTTDGVTTTAEITDQDLVGGTEDARGWEYEIVSARVWPVSAKCDCHTVLGYTSPF